jgi:hypothetical protein
VGWGTEAAGCLAPVGLAAAVREAVAVEGSGEVVVAVGRLEVECTVSAAVGAAVERPLRIHAPLGLTAAVRPQQADAG